MGVGSMEAGRAADRGSVSGYSGGGGSGASSASSNSAGSDGSMAAGRAVDRASVDGYSGDSRSRSASSSRSRSQSAGSMAKGRAADRASVPGYSADAGQPNSTDAASTASLTNAHAEYAQSRLRAGRSVPGRLNSDVAPSHRQAEIQSMAALDTYRAQEQAQMARHAELTAAHRVAEIKSMEALAAYRGEQAATTALGTYSPTNPGWHDYTVTSMVCSADLACSPQEIADQLARYAVPGQNPAAPVVNGAIYSVYDPFLGLPAGDVLTRVAADKLSITNQTLPEHVFYDGKITRTAWRAADGSWHVTTRGIGNNEIPGMNKVNQWSGPDIFNELDRRMRENIERHHRSAEISVN